MTQPASVHFEHQNCGNASRSAKVTQNARSLIADEATGSAIKDRLQYLEELKEAVADAHSGYGHSSEQIHTWMRSWGAESELPAPEADNQPST